ncbi:MAG: GNAT family N-acetyltransferase [Pseudoxanthomonas sp.]
MAEGAPVAQVRAAVAGDADEVARLSNLLGYPAAVGTMAQRLAQVLARDDHALFVAQRTDGADGLLGMVAVEWRLMLELGERGEIVAMVVDPAARRQGVGRRLIEAACDWARRRGGEEVFLRSNVVRPEAHAFYPGIGFARSKTQHVYVRRLDPAGVRGGSAESA